MRLVRQRKASDCGIAAVAMIADVTYDRAKAAFGSFSGRGYHTEAEDLRRALKRLGVGLAKKPRPLRGAIQIRLPFDAIVLVGLGCEHGCEGDHWIVWDAQAQRLLDPLRRRAKATYAFCECFKVKRGLNDGGRASD